MKILEITERPHLADKLGYHLLISVFAFMAAYAFFLFGSDADFIIYFLDHPSLKFTLCAAAVVVVNLFTAINGFKKYHVVAIDYLESTQSLKFELISRYVKTPKQVEHSLSEMYWEEKEASILGLDTKRIVLFKTNLGKPFARIDTSYNPWSWKRQDIKKAMLHLEKIHRSKSSEGYAPKA